MEIILQLDLARQKETVAYICEMADFAAGNGYTALMLYLEGGVRTASFSFADPERSYSIAEMEEVIGYAAKRGIKVIPALNALGHCELFLSHPELAHLSEQRELPPDRKRMELCPSDPAVLEFLTRYVSEVAAIFPAEELHVGCDEVFRLASCSRCRARLAAGTTHAEIFAEHLKFLYAICVKLGKKMAIWDDMADFFPELLETLPREIVQVFWEYNEVVDGKETKYGNRRRIDILNVYENSGRPCWVAPREVWLGNTLSISEYAFQHKPDGMLMTTWEHEWDFLYAFLPQVAFAGRWWKCRGQGDAEAVFAEAVKDLFGCSDPIFTGALRMVADAPKLDGWSGLFRPNGPELAGFRRSPGSATSGLIGMLRMARTTLLAFSDRIGRPLGKKVLAALLLRVECELLIQDTLLWQNQLWRNDGSADPAELKEAWERNLAERERLWQIFRPGLDAGRMRMRQSRPIPLLERHAAARKAAGGYLELRLLLPDPYGRESLTVELAGADGVFQSVFAGMPKPEWAGDLPFYTYYAPVPAMLANPEKMRLTASGDNGVGVVFAGMRRFDGASFMPGRLLRQDGLFEHPEALLNDDTTWAMLGNRDGHRSLWNPEMNTRKHVLEFELKKF